MRFWGKMLTQNKDYYVAEGFVENDIPDYLTPDNEPKGEGVNMYTYWVSYDVLDQWIELPQITPKHIQQSRNIKYIFTGDLNAKVQTYPLFEGKEKHLLKAQIVRISSGSVLAPSGMFKLNEENKENEKNILFEEGFKLPEFPELKEMDKWVHKHCHILKQGRCSLYFDPKLTEEEKEMLETNDPDSVPRLQEISQDKGPYYIEGDESENAEALVNNYKIKEIGDLQQFNMLNSSLGCYGQLYIKNLTWPGSILAANSNQFVNLYIGYGLKENQPVYLPLKPNDLMEEENDNEEHPEPNPDKEIFHYETDSDEEKNKENEEEDD